MACANFNTSRDSMTRDASSRPCRPQECAIAASDDPSDSHSETPIGINCSGSNMHTPYSANSQSQTHQATALHPVQKRLQKKEYENEARTQLLRALNHLRILLRPRPSPGSRRLQHQINVSESPHRSHHCAHPWRDLFVVEIDAE